MHESNSEDWKPVFTLNKTLQSQIEKITETIDAIISSTPEHDKFLGITLQLILADSWNVQAKLKSAEACNMYSIYMENAAIIRSLMRQIKTLTFGLGNEMFDKKGGVEQNYILLLRNEIEDFRITFVEWVSYFEKDDFDDEWGLY